VSTEALSATTKGVAMMRPLEDPEDRLAVVSLALATIMLLMALAR
jgi:hypothetical protein